MERGSGKVKSPTSPGGVQGVALGGSVLALNGDFGLTLEPKPWNEGCCCCGFVLFPPSRFLPWHDEDGGGRWGSCSQWGFAFPPTLPRQEVSCVFYLGCCNGVLLFWVLLLHNPVPGDTPGEGSASPSHLPRSCGMRRERR